MRNNRKVLIISIGIALLFAGCLAPHELIYISDGENYELASIRVSHIENGFTSSAVNLKDADRIECVFKSKLDSSIVPIHLSQDWENERGQGTPEYSILCPGMFNFGTTQLGEKEQAPLVRFLDQVDIQKEKNPYRVQQILAIRLFAKGNAPAAAYAKIREVEERASQTDHPVPGSYFNE
jgi:hypothetical protein